MKAYLLDSYGPADALRLADIARPEPAAGEVLVRVRATSVNPYDWHLMRGEPRVGRLMPGVLGLRGPAVRILGCDVAGQVEAAGSGVTGFRPGDDVFALLPGGGFGEYVSVPAGQLAPLPAGLDYEQAAAMPMAALTALRSLRDHGRLRPGQQVLINGASGGVGTFAVQIARALGAKVTGVCGSRNAGLVASIGANEVIDYTAEDFTRRSRRYDLVLDIAGGRPVAACRRVLTPRGTLVVVGGQAGRWLAPAGRMLAALAQGPLVSQRIFAGDAVPLAGRRQDLVTLGGLVADGAVAPVIGGRYDFAQLPAAIRHSEAGHPSGKLVVTVAA
jgi:NADPH:quinone reductase-like Zn-dependent oxidoreductase